MIMFTRSVWRTRLRDNLQYTKECDQNSQTRLKLYKDVHLINPYRPFRMERWKAIHGTYGYINHIESRVDGATGAQYYLKYR